MTQQERDGLERRREGDRRFYLWLFGSLAGVVVLGVIAIVYVLASNGVNNSGGEVQPAATQLSSPTETEPAQPPVGPGKDLFASTCGGCHTLAAAGATGTVGPNLDDLKPDQATVLAAMQDGPGAMPANLLTGAEAQQVAAFVAASAGR
jgi:mono/diheme cytochrome c family protein